MKKRMLNIVLALILIFTSLSVVGCDKTPVKPALRIEVATSKIADVEVGEDFTLEKAKVLNNKDEDVTSANDVTSTVLDPVGETVFVENDIFSVDKLGIYKIKYSLIDKPDVTLEISFKTKDTKAPVITALTGFKNDVFKNDKVYLPTIGVEDASGCKPTKISIIDKISKTEIALADAGKSFIAESLGGYTMKVVVEDNGGNKTPKELDIRVTDKYIDSTHLKGKELATFGNDKYLNNIKAFGSQPTCKFELKSEGIPEVTSNNVGSKDGKVLSITPAGKRERSWLRIWLPKSIKRSELKTIKMKMYANEAVDMIWWFNSELGAKDAEGAWYMGDPAMDELAEINYNQWTVIETPLWRIWDTLYTEDQAIEYLDLAIYYKEDSKIESKLYIDEISYDTLETSFQDTTLADKVIADFDEVYQGNDGDGYAEHRGYEDTIKMRTTNEPMGCRRMVRSFHDVNDATEFKGVTGTASGKALKVTPVWGMSEFFLTLPTTLNMIENGQLEIRMMIKESVNDDSYIQFQGEGLTNKFFMVKTKDLEKNKWVTVKVPMSIFAKDVTDTNKEIKILSVRLEAGRHTKQSVYFDEIKISNEPAEAIPEKVLTDFTAENDSFTLGALGNDNATATYLTGDEAGKYSKGALKVSFTANPTGKDFQSITLTLKKSLTKKDIKDLTITMHQTGGSNFFRAYFIFENDTNVELGGDNFVGSKVWADATSGLNELVANTPVSLGNHANWEGYNKIVGIVIDINTKGGAVDLILDKITYNINFNV